MLVRLGTKDENELRDGFPKTADELYRYDAVILDDIEAEFFTQDQLMLLENFVSRRGGGLLMLGGPDSFAAGQLRPHAGRRPAAGVSSTAAARRASGDEFRLALTREGWLQPWVRTRNTEPEERARLAAMPPFRAVSRCGQHQAGRDGAGRGRRLNGTAHPALVTQRFGSGRSAALLIGDLWRWGHAPARPTRKAIWKNRGGKRCAGWWPTCRGASRSTCEPQDDVGQSERWPCVSACAMPNTCRSTTRKWRSKSRRPTASR